MQISPVIQGGQLAIFYEKIGSTCSLEGLFDTL